jgi:hypothetical protein
VSGGPGVSEGSVSDGLCRRGSALKFVLKLALKLQRRDHFKVESGRVRPPIIVSGKKGEDLLLSEAGQLAREACMQFVGRRMCGPRFWNMPRHTAVHPCSLLGGYGVRPPRMLF